MAPLICELLPDSGPRFVDVFAGRGNVSWAVMTLLQYKRHWINALGTYDFFAEIKYGIYEVPERDPKQPNQLYYAMKERMRNPPKTLKVPFGIPAWTDFENLPEGITVAQRTPGGQPFIDKDGMVTLNLPKEHHKAHPAALLEGFLSFSGGTYTKAGPKGLKRGGVSRKGFERSLAVARLLMLKKRPRLTAWDYMKVLAECKPSDVVYLDVPYKDAKVAAYDDRTMDFPGLVQTLLKAPFKWMLSEYNNRIYEPLTKKFGPPVKIPVQRTMTNANQGEGRKTVIECLWKNF